MSVKVNVNVTNVNIDKDADPAVVQSAIQQAQKPNKEKRHMGMKAKRILGNIVVYIVLVLMSVVWLAPFVCIVLQSFRCESTWMTGYIIPKTWGFKNYVTLFTKTKFPRWFLNTTIISIATAALQLIIILCMSYTLSRLRFRGRKALMNAMLVLGLFPGILGMIILYRIHTTKCNSMFDSRLYRE